jgi:hypothetical protein
VVKRQQMKNMALKLSSALEENLLRRSLHPPFLFEVV